MELKWAITAALLSAALAGCGGGGGGGGSGSAGSGTSTGGAADSGTGGTPAPASCMPTMANPLACSAKLGMVLINPSGAATTQVQPDSAGTLVVTVQDWDGRAVPNTVVSFSTTDNTGGFVPAAGTALTDANGVARIGLPAGARTGAFTATANATVRGSTLQASVSYVVAFPTLALSAMTVPASLSAGANAAISVTVLSNDQPYTAPLPVSFSSPCATAGKATLSSPVTTQNGVASASYSDKGCGVPDVITASVTLGDATVVQTGTITVLPATAGSLSFVASDTSNIALAGTGGIGRQEFATLRFKVFDTTGTAVSGTRVRFGFANLNGGEIAAIGGLKLHPDTAISSPDGTVTTLVSGGTLPTSVRVKAVVDGTNLSTLSNVLVVSTGVPDQQHFSLSTTTGNCEGWTLDQDECSIVTVRMADHFGNPVPDGTAVNFTAEGGNIEASCITGQLLPSTTPAGESTNSKQGPGSGSCSVQLRSASPRHPDDRYVPPAQRTSDVLSHRGRVTVMAYALGEEDFNDRNGNNLCDDCDAARDAADSEFTSQQDQPRDIYRDDDENKAYTPGEPCVGPNNGSCSTPGDGRYNGVLRNPPASPVAPTLPPSIAPTTYVSAQLVQIFSGSEATITFEQADGTVMSNLSCPPGKTAKVYFRARDENGNPMPAGSKIDLQALFGVVGTPVIPATMTVNNYVLKLRDPTPDPRYEAIVGCGGGSGTLIVKVTTPVKKAESVATLPIN
ncbi:hypothetical protein [uncultured Azohydromonas sp.]|jgi:hypothetical protein|uniref:hypothetical protein n=1 Tax=uncultured Azohydromonas sp. TaxID=487342 RepID=UPI00261635D4|nr:hypothetical protein [uncultured Azohydromonas sp.]